MENDGKRVFLLTGPPGCGKTTAIRHIVERLDAPVGGFYTKEIRADGRRVGFRISTLDGKEGVLAHAERQDGPNVGRYRVDLDSLNSIAVDSLREAMAREELVVVDEIGPMEMLSAYFRQAVRELLESELLAIGSIVARSTSFGDEVKVHPVVQVVEMDRLNRDEIAAQLADTLEKRMAAGG